PGTEPPGAGEGKPTPGGRPLLARRFLSHRRGRDRGPHTSPGCRGRAGRAARRPSPPARAPAQLWESLLMAMDMFIKIGELKGESRDKTHKDEIDVLAWSWGISN